MMGGSAVAYARSAKDLGEDLVMVRPTVLLGVPRVFERMCAAIRANVENSVGKRILLRLFEQAAVIGEGRPFLAALILLNSAAWKRFAEENHEKPDRPNAPSAKIKLLARVQQLLGEFPRYAQVSAIHLTLQPWTIDAGLLTPTLKVKRDVLQRVFANEIEKLFGER